MQDFRRSTDASTGPGPRPSVWIPFDGYPVISKVLGSRDGPPPVLDEWHPDWRQFLRRVTRRRLTLGWADIPTQDTDYDAQIRLGAALWEALPLCPTVTLTCEEVYADARGVHLGITDTPELRQLAATVRSHFVEVFGEAVPVHGAEDDWRPAITIALGIADVDTSDGVVTKVEPALTESVFRVFFGEHDPCPPEDTHPSPYWRESDIAVDHARYRAGNGGQLPQPNWAEEAAAIPHVLERIKHAHLRAVLEQKLGNES